MIGKPGDGRTAEVSLATTERMTKIWKHVKGVFADGGGGEEQVGFFFFYTVGTAPIFPLPFYNNNASCCKSLLYHAVLLL